MLIKRNKQKKSIFILIISLILIILAFLYFFFMKTNQLEIQALDTKADLDPLIKQAAKRAYVLLGESSHGTSEYYIWRKIISQRLITEHDFNFIVVEGDWDALYKINLYVKHLSHPAGGAKEILSSFQRWPTWMWANYEFLSLVEWLREYNAQLALEDRVGIYGQDVYGLNNSMLELIEYLNEVDQSLAQEVEKLYECLLVYQDDLAAYVDDVFQQGISCQAEVNKAFSLLLTIEEKNNKDFDHKKYFKAKQDALVAIYGEKHYRHNIYPGPAAWNFRVKGMVDRFDNLLDFYGPKAKAIVWAHNTHVGDARATSMIDNNSLNLGQLLREEHGENKVYIVGFGTNSGTVRAGLAWGEPGRTLIIPQAQPGSLEEYLARLDNNNFIVLLDQKNLPDLFKKPIGHRAIGVVYNPSHDQGNYVDTILKDRYNAFIFLEKTKALKPL